MHPLLQEPYVASLYRDRLAVADQERRLAQVDSAGSRSAPRTVVRRWLGTAFVAIGRRHPVAAASELCGTSS